MPLGIRENELSTFLEEYLPRLDEGIRTTFKINETAVLNGFEPYFLKFVRKSETETSDAQQEIEGLVVFNIDPRIHDRVRLNLHHVSTVAREDFSEGLKLCMEFIWRRVYCDEVRVALVHLKNAEGKLVVDTELRDVLKNEQRFKWKTLTNEDGKRKLIMAVERTAVDLQFENPRAIVP